VAVLHHNRAGILGIQMSWKRKTAWTAIGLSLLMVLVLAGGYIYLKSDAFKQFALRRIVDEADQATGAKTAIRGMDFSLSGLTANLDDITLRGTESPGQPPLLHADKLTVGIKIVSLLHRKVSLSELLVMRPVVHVQVSRYGKNNLPTAPPSQNSSHTSVFDLAIGHAQITDGEIDYNDQKTPLNADLYDFGTDIRFSPGQKRYDGTLSYKNGRLQYARYSPLPHNFDLTFSATPERLSIESANLQVGSSGLQLRAQVSNYSNPIADGTYRLLLHAQDFAEMYPGAKAQGNVSLTGRLHYQAVEGRPVLKNVLIDGQVASEVLAAAASGKRIELRNLDGNYRLANGNLMVSSLRTDTLGGRIAARAEMNHLDTTLESHIRTSLQDISLRALQQFFGAGQLHGAVVSGRLDGSAEATWTGEIGNLRARSDLTLHAQAGSTANPSAQEVPMNGAVHVTYDGQHQSIELHDTSLRIPAANLTAQGTISEQSSLRLQLVADDLHELASLAASFGSNQTLPAVSGKATLNALVQGSLKKPTIAAQVNANDLHVQGSEWTSATLSLRANPSELRVEDGRLKNARQGQATFTADVQLHNWAYEPSGRIQAKLDAQQFRLSDLQQLANQHYPMSGLVTTKLSIDGSELSPSGNGQVEIASATAYGEPIEKLKASFHTDNGAIVSKLSIAAKAGSLDGDLSYTPKTRAYNIRVEIPAIVLQHLQVLQEKNLQLTGTVTASVRGEGTVDDPQLVATVALPELQAKGKSISELRAEARVGQHRLDVNLDSKVSQVAVHAQGQVALTGNYDAQAQLDTGTIPLDALMAAYAASVPAGFQGQTEAHATLRGPLKDKAQVEAHLSIPVLKASYQSLQIGITQPIRVDYANSVVTLQPTDIEGTGTSLHAQGRIPIGGASGPTVAADGTLDLQILKVFAPSVQSSGSLALDVKGSGTSKAPQVQGQVRLKDVAFSTQDAPIGIEKLNGTLDISNDRIQVSQMNGVMGGGQVSLGGAITYRPSLQFNLAMQSRSVRLLYPDGLRTLLDANLSFSGTPSASALNGRVLIDSLSFTPDFDLAGFADQVSSGGTVAQPGFADTVKLTISVQSRENLNATSSQVSIAGQAALQVGGTAANPVITGRTTLTSGELFYRNVRYQLQRGVITFDDPNETHPVLNISVTTAIEQYNLTLTLRGPLDKLTTSYVSDPPLATADIINLVARGKTTQESAASSQSTDSMIASQAASEVSSSVQKLAGISSLQIDPTIGGNGQNPSARVAIQQRVTRSLLFTFSTDVSQPGSEIVQGEYQLNKRWSVSVERDQLGGVSIDGRYHSRF
jgi:translocation and assembly module TamB